MSIAKALRVFIGVALALILALISIVLFGHVIKVNKIIDVQLFATLAGLSLTALAFVTSNIIKTKHLITNIQELDRLRISLEEQKKLNDMLVKGASNLLWAFYLFSAGLVGQLTLSRWSELKASGGSTGIEKFVELFVNKGFITVIDTIVAVGTLYWGLTLLLLGARKFGRIINKDKPTKNDK